MWRAANGPAPSPEHLTPAQAQDVLRGLLAASARLPTDPRRRRPAERTFGDACRSWLLYIEHDRARRPSTVNDYRNALRRYLLPEFGEDTLLRLITTERIEDYRERLLAEGRLSRRTIQKVLVILHGVLKRAKRKGWIAANPAADVERVTVPRTGDFNVLTPDEVHAVARADGSELYGAFFITAAFSGLRLGELRALRWGDLDFAGRVVHVRRSYASGAFGPPKSQKVRSVPMSDQVARVLDGLSRRADGTGPDDLVFTLGHNVPLHHDTARKRFYVALAAAGLGRLREKEDPIVFHDLRHTFGTLAVQVFPLSDVRAMMGHAEISTTMIYVHHVPQVDAADRLSRLLAAQQESHTVPVDA